MYGDEGDVGAHGASKEVASALTVTQYGPAKAGRSVFMTCTSRHTKPQLTTHLLQAFSTSIDVVQIACPNI